MLHSLELENFKAFGERVSVPFAPITLIFGENSAGKSSILQALNLLKQTYRNGDIGTLLLPISDNGIVDLGSFREMLFDHDLKRTLSIRVGTDSKTSVEFSFRKPSLKTEVLLDQVAIYYGEPSECIAKFKPLEPNARPKSTRQMRRSVHRPIIRDSIPLSELTEVECVWVTESTQYWKPEYEKCKENLEDIQIYLSDRKDDLDGLLARRRAKIGMEAEQENSKEEIDKNLQREIECLNIDLKFFSTDFDLQTYIAKRREEEVGTILGLRNFLPVRHIQPERYPWLIPSRPLSRGEFNIANIAGGSNIADITMRAGRTLERILGAIFPMGPLRQSPKRTYPFGGITPREVGLQGEFLPDLLYRRPKLVENVNKWLKQFDIGYKIKISPIETFSGDLFEIRLIDTRREKPVNVALADVGYGISQLLPFVVQGLVSENRIISIEQPEVHVHPRLQADIGDLLAKSIQEPRSNRFIIETHSEHLILRLQRLVYEKRIKPEDISVIYVSRGTEGSKVQRLRLDEEGDFIDEWPNGFFPERLRELR